MKPFDLEAAKRGEPIAYRDGTLVHFVGVTRGNCIVIENDVGLEEMHHAELRMAPKKVTGYINVFRISNGTLITGSSIHPTPEAAAFAGSERIDVIKYTYEE